MGPPKFCHDKHFLTKQFNTDIRLDIVSIVDLTIHNSNTQKPHLHLLGNVLPVREDLPQCHGAQHIPQGGGGQQPGRAAIVVNIGHSRCRIPDLVVHDGIDKHCHRVLC